MFGVALLNGMIRNDPGAIVGPIATFMGWIIDFVFNIVYPFTEKNSLGISIIFLTIIMRFVMLPLAVKSQKSMMAMQKLAPEMEKIKKKYGNTKDPELMQKMNAETQALYAKNKVNPLSGCLPLFIQMPIFFALSYLMDQSFLYIGKLKAIYELLASAIHSIGVAKWAPMVNELAIAHTPQNLLHKFDMAPVKDPVTGELTFHNLEKILNRFTPEDWDKLFHGNPANAAVSNLITEAPTAVYNQIVGLLEQKQNIEMFFGLNMLEASGWRFPQLIIPILTVVTTLLTSWLSMKMTAKTNQDQNAVMQQRIMLFAMPLVMGFFTVGYPIGVGIYWITSSVFQVVQQVFLNNKYGLQNSVEKREEKSHI